MPIYSYKAKKGTETVFGQVTATNQDEALEMLNHAGLVPVTLDVRTSVNTSADMRAGKIKRKEIYILTKQLVSLIQAGTSILRALDLLRAQTKNTYLRAILTAIAQDIRGGRPFSDSLTDYPQVFSSLYVNLIRAGEETGKLKEVLNSLADYQKSQDELTSKIKSALAYPIFMSGVGVLTIVFILIFVLPKITGLFTDLNNLPFITKILMRSSDFLKTGWPILAMVIGLLFFLTARYKKTEGGRRAFYSFQLRAPLLGVLTMKSEIAKLSRTLEILLRSDIPILKAIQIALPIMDNDLIKEQFLRAHRDLSGGSSLGASLRKSELIPVLVSDLVSVGEESGALAVIFKDIADMYEQDTKESIKTMTSLLEPLLILVVGSVIALIVFAMLLPIFQVDVFAR